MSQAFRLGLPRDRAGFVRYCGGCRPRVVRPGPARPLLAGGARCPRGGRGPDGARFEAVGRRCGGGHRGSGRGYIQRTPRARSGRLRDLGVIDYTAGRGRGHVSRVGVLPADKGALNAWSSEPGKGSRSTLEPEDEPEAEREPSQTGEREPSLKRELAAPVRVEPSSRTERTRGASTPVAEMPSPEPSPQPSPQQSSPHESSTRSTRGPKPPTVSRSGAARSSSALPNVRTGHSTTGVT